MAEIRIESAERPFDQPPVGRAAAELLTHADAMGLLEGAEPVRRLDWATLLQVIARVSAAGIATLLARGVDRSLEREPEKLTALLRTITGALEASPLPDREWQRMLGIFGVDELARLLEVAPSSARRYSSSARSTPDEVAARLHTLARIVHHLAGAYNERGVRRWFSRKRSALDGRTPADVLSGEWRPDDTDVARVMDLARTLSGSPAT